MRGVNARVGVVVRVGVCCTATVVTGAVVVALFDVVGLRVSKAVFEAYHELRAG